MIHVVLPAHLRTLARVDSEVELDVQGRVTLRSVLDALEARYPMLRGTIRDHVLRSAALSCAFSCAKRIGPMNRRTLRCPLPSRPGRSPS